MRVPRSRDPLRGFAPPRAPESLRTRVLAGAREAAAAVPVPSWSDRIWFSSRWRLAWVLVCALSVLGEFAAIEMASRGGARGVSPQVEIAREGDAAAAELGLAGRGWIGDAIVQDGTRLTERSVLVR